MKIAFFSYEFPPETGGGGIGTYLELLTDLLIERGHTVVVFAGTKNALPFWEKMHVYRIPAANWEDFNYNLLFHFKLVHSKYHFEVIECTDYKGTGLTIKEAFPSIPTVVRLHTPSYLIDKLQFEPLRLQEKIKFRLGGLRRGKWFNFPKPPNPEKFISEFRLLELADLVNSPSLSIFTEMKSLGFCLDGKTEFTPLPFFVEDDSLNVKSRSALETNPQIFFIGRLEKRKGVLEIAQVIPSILKSDPKAHFTFIGVSAASPLHNISMEKYLKKKLKKYLKSISFLGGMQREKVLECISNGDIFLFPSHYESFGIACCEAMAAGKAVIGSTQGGMSEIIENGKSGILVPPRSPRHLAKAIRFLINNEENRTKLGDNARKRIKEFLSPEKIVAMQLECYRKAIVKVKSAKGREAEILG